MRKHAAGFGRHEEPRRTALRVIGVLIVLVIAVFLIWISIAHPWGIH